MHAKCSEDMLIGFAFPRSVAFSFVAPNLSLKSFALPFSVFYVSLSSVQLAKQGTMSYRTTTVVTQSGTLVGQLVLVLW
jgi:hypothetical protein